MDRSSCPPKTPLVEASSSWRFFLAIANLTERQRPAAIGGVSHDETHILHLRIMIWPLNQVETREFDEFGLRYGHAGRG
jgi:hypothetical protein